MVFFTPNLPQEPIEAARLHSKRRSKKLAAGGSRREFLVAAPSVARRQSRSKDRPG
jgi:hypothetical protein